MDNLSLFMEKLNNCFIFTLNASSLGVHDNLGICRILSCFLFIDTRFWEPKQM